VPNFCTAGWLLKDIVLARAAANTAGKPLRAALVALVVGPAA